MIGVVILLTGIGIGAMLTVAVQATSRLINEYDRRLPAATPRAIARVRRRNRLEVRHLIPAREAGVRVVDARDYDLPRLGEPPSFDPFREEHTR